MLTTGSEPPAIGTSGRTVGLLKVLSVRRWSLSNLGNECWRCVVKYAVQFWWCMLFNPWYARRFRRVSAHHLVCLTSHCRGLRLWQHKVSGRKSIVRGLMFWDHLSDQASSVPCPPDSELDDTMVYKTGLPVFLHLMHFLHLNIMMAPLMTVFLNKLLNRTSQGISWQTPLELDLGQVNALDREGENSFPFLFWRMSRCTAHCLT